MHMMVKYKVEKYGLCDGTVTESLLHYPIQEDVLMTDVSLERDTWWLAGDIFTNDLDYERASYILKVCRRKFSQTIKLWSFFNYRHWFINERESH